MGRQFARAAIPGVLILLIMFSLLSNIFAITFQNLRIAPPDKTTNARIKAAFAQLPLSFVPNLGQVDRQAKYLSRGRGHTLFLTGTDAVLAFSLGPSNVAAVRIGSIGPTRREPVLMVENQLTWACNYIVGNAPSRWYSNIPNYARARYRQIYDGIDQIYYDKQGQSGFDFVIAPGAEPNWIMLRVDGIKELSVNDQGGLLMAINGDGELQLSRVVAYQEHQGQRHIIDARFEVRGTQEISFKVGAYDRTRPLVIGTSIVPTHSTELSAEEDVLAMAVDGRHAYLTGFTHLADFPASVGAFRTAFGAWRSHAFVMKLDRKSSMPIYSLFLGGNASAVANGISVDYQGNAYVTGYTRSSNYPTTVGAFQTTVGGGQFHVFVTKIDITGSCLIYSTFLGGNGNDRGEGIALDAEGNAYITGSASSKDFPTTKGAFRVAHSGGSWDAFVTKIDTTGSKLIYSTYLGGSGDNFGSRITVDARGRAIVTGTTNSKEFSAAVGSRYMVTGSDGRYSFKIAFDTNGQLLDHQ